MEKPIIATQLSGIFVSKEPFVKAHTLWFEKASKELKRPDMADWGIIHTQAKDYFPKVAEIMELQYPELSSLERTKLARKTFFEYVTKYFETEDYMKYVKVVDLFKQTKKDFQLALISTIPKNSLDIILSKLEIQTLFDIIETTSIEEKDNYLQVYQRFFKKYGSQ